jgi:cleavage and polyadenylation specificity factor subunit 3
MHPGYTGQGALPFFDEIDPEEIDLLLITHFHLDHAAGLPYFTEKTAFKGRIFMTHPTKAVLKMMIADSLRVSSESMLFNAADLDRCLSKVELIGLHQVMEVDGIKFSCYNAGHVLGAAMFMIEIAGIRTLYTGDYTREEDRHLMSAEIPNKSPEVLICEATLGKMIQPDRQSREKLFLDHVEKVLKRGGRCLIPMFALGRAQEIMLILEEHWAKSPHLQRYPIYYAAQMADRALRVYQTFANVMNRHIKEKLNVRNPFRFKHIHQLRSIDSFDDDEPCVFLASPGMLQSGVSRKLFERWCPDERNSCFMPGYAVEGTLAKKLQGGSPDEVLALNGKMLPRRCSVEYVPFIAHADFKETSEFVRTLQPAKIVLVHGEENGMRNLGKALANMMKPTHDKIEVLTPRNTEVVKFQFKRDKIARIVGHLADQKPSADQVVNGIFVTENFVHHIVAAEDVSTYTRLSLNKISQRIHVPYPGKYDMLKLYLGDVFDLDFVKDAPPGSELYNKTDKSEKTPSIIVSKVITVTHCPPERVLLEWDASPVNDMVADAVAAIIAQAALSPATVQRTSKPCSHNHHHDHRIGPGIPSKEEFQEKQIQYMYMLRNFMKDRYGKSGVSLFTEKDIKVDKDCKDLEEEISLGDMFDSMYKLVADTEKFILLCSLQSGKYQLIRLPKPKGEKKEQSESDGEQAEGASTENGGATSSAGDSTTVEENQEGEGTEEDADKDDWGLFVLDNLKMTIDGSLMGMTSYIYDCLSETKPYKDDSLHDREITPEEEAQQLADQIKLFEDFAKEAGEEILQSIVAEGEQRKEVEQMIQADVAEEAAMAAAAAKKSSEGQK